MQTAELWMFPMWIYNVDVHFAIISILAVNPDVKFMLSGYSCQLLNFAFLANRNSILYELVLS